MAKFMKSFIGQIGGIAGRVAGSETYDSEVDKESRVRESPVESKLSLSGSEEADALGSGSSNEDEDYNYEQEQPSIKGSLNKWTNYLHGWQERYFVVADGILSYYKSEFDTQFGCRGSVSLHKSKVLLHEFDELRFDIRAHDCSYFLRASSVQEKDRWVEAIEANKRVVPENGLDSAIRRQGSVLSLSGLSQASTSSFKVGQDLASKVMELETYRDILCRQVDLLQAYFDSLAEGSTTSSTAGHEGASNGISTSVESIDESPEEQGSSDPSTAQSSAPSTPSTQHSYRGLEARPVGPAHHSPLPSRFTPKGHRRTGSDPFAFRPAQLSVARGFSRGHAPHFTAGGGGGPPPDLSNVDFKGEAITFKATTAGVISTLSYCLEVMNKREEYWQKKFEKEQERRRKAEVAAHSALNGPRVRAFEYAGPDFQEGPHSALNEDEFFDALEMAYQQDEMGPASDSPEKKADEDGRPVEANAQPESASPLLQEISHKSVSGIQHRLTPLVDEKVSQYSSYIFEPVDISVWSVAHEEDDMKVYRRELEEDNVVVDPLKASYMVPGVTAQEVVNYFYDKDHRLSWDGMVETVEVVETLAEDTIIFHQLHKRVWPSTQRETLYCSHKCTLTNAPCPDNMVGYTWMVCNFSLDHDKVPSTSKLIRATLHVGLVCQTVVNHPVAPGKESDLTREDISCKMIYAANVNPGGWAPAAVVRTIAKREICKFIKTFREAEVNGDSVEEVPAEQTRADTMPIDNPETAKEEERTLTDHLNKKLLESFLARMDAGTTGFQNLPQPQPQSVEDNDFD